MANEMHKSRRWMRRCESRAEVARRASGERHVIRVTVISTEVTVVQFTFSSEATRASIEWSRSLMVEIFVSHRYGRHYTPDVCKG